MHEVTGNLWDFEADFRCITTNGFVKKNGEAVMGRGCAAEAAKYWPDLPEVFGQIITHGGNHVRQLGFWVEKKPNAMDLISFPVKHHWKQKADPNLIERSAKELKDLIDYYDTFDESITTVVVPRPGCGNGQLNWEDVKPVLEPYFDERFYVITYE